MFLQYISQQLTIYIGLCLFTAGIFGNIINIWVFTSKRSYRTTPCTFYFLVASINSILAVLIGLSDRILYIGFEIDLTYASNYWCKIREFSHTVPSPLAITCLCLATIDQFFVTSKNHSLRRCSQIKWTYRILIIATTIWFCNGIPFLLFYNVSPITNSCMNKNPNFDIYISIFVLGVLFIIPVSLMTLFAWLTYRNIRQTIALANQNVDRQLIKMTLFQVGLVIISFLPYGIYNIYMLLTINTTVDNDQTKTENSILSIISLVYYLFYTMNCYAFLFSSRRFRQAVKERLLCRKRDNQIVPH